MTTSTRNRRVSKRRRLLFPALLATVAATGAAATTHALFSDSASITENGFTGGTVALSATPATAALTLADMAPGDVSVAPVTVSNTGTLTQRYAMSATATGALAPALQMTVKAGVTSCTATGFDATGTVLYGPGPVGTGTAIRVVGDPASGQQAGDRLLAAGDTDVVCVRVALPGATTTDTYQGAAGNVTLTFDAEQTANN